MSVSAGFENDVALEIQDLFQLFQRHIDHQADAARQRFQEPDMRDRRGQLDMAHALAAHLGQRDFDAAFFADDAAELHPLVFAAEAFVVLDRTKNARAEQAVAFRLERTIIDGFRLLDLAVRPDRSVPARPSGSGSDQTTQPDQPAREFSSAHSYRAPFKMGVWGLRPQLLGPGGRAPWPFFASCSQKEATPHSDQDRRSAQEISVP